MYMTRLFFSLLVIVIMERDRYDSHVLIFVFLSGSLLALNCLSADA